MSHSDILTLAGVITDLAMGLVAYRLARSLERTQVQQTEILRQLDRRVERLETRTLGYQLKVGAE